MSTLINCLSKGRCTSLFSFSRLFSSNRRYEKIEGIRDNFNEYEVRLHFNKWLRSLWLAPNQWVYSTRDRSIKVTGYFLPFWSIDFQGSIQCSLSTKANFPFRHDETYYSHKEWHSFPLEINNISLNNINIYAAKTFDTYHVQKLDVDFDNSEIQDLTPKKNKMIIDKPTLDQETAFNHAWILIMKSLLENMCLEQGKKIYPKFEEPRIDSFHLKINSKQQRLLYYPVYTITYKYKSHINYTCLFDGVTGHITGDRQYSAIKVTLATFIACYPLIKIGLFCLGSLTDLLFAFELASNFSLWVGLPIALIIAPCVGLYASYFPKSYKTQIKQVQWKQDELKSFKFTYDFIDTIEQEKNQLMLQNDQKLNDDVSLLKEQIRDSSLKTKTN